MALEFPNSPTNGQTYTDPNSGASYTYEAATTSWKKYVQPSDPTLANGCIQLSTTSSYLNISSGMKGYGEVPYNATANSWLLVGGAGPGNANVEIWKTSSFDPSAPTSANNIVSGFLVIRGANTKNSGAASAILSNLVFARGDVLAMNVHSCNNFQTLTLSIQLIRS